jgi:hypothetical protein
MTAFSTSCELVTLVYIFLALCAQRRFLNGNS